jgi:hypothetical protein
MTIYYKQEMSWENRRRIHRSADMKGKQRNTFRDLPD